MLLLMMEAKGKINNRQIKKAAFGEMHFDEANNFISIERDKITGQVSAAFACPCGSMSIHLIILSFVSDLPVPETSSLRRVILGLSS